MATPQSLEAPWCRNPIVALSGLPSSYPSGVALTAKEPIENRSYTAWATKDCVDALIAVYSLVRGQGGDLCITEVGRPFRVSAAARGKYLKHPDTHAFVAPPGGSMHNGGQAVDWDAYHLNFKGVPSTQWLELLWDIAIPQGFSPIIKTPVFMSECWHFDFRGCWQDTYSWFKRNLPSKAYSQMARCAILDAGVWDLEYDTEHDQSWLEVAYIQAQLHRVGSHKVGVVDGIYGVKTKNALEYLGIPLPVTRGNDKEIAYELNKMEAI